MANSKIDILDEDATSITLLLHLKDGRCFVNSIDKTSYHSTTYEAGTGKMPGEASFGEPNGA